MKYALIIFKLVALVYRVSPPLISMYIQFHKLFLLKPHLDGKRVSIALFVPNLRMLNGKLWYRWASVAILELGYRGLRVHQLYSEIITFCEVCSLNMA